VRERTTRRVSRAEPCPVCGEPTWCRVARDGSYAVCNRVESAKSGRGQGGGWVHRLADSLSAPPPAASPSRPPPATAENDLAPIGRRDEAYRRLRAAAKLHGKHVVELRQRGYSPDEIKARAYGTLPLRGRARLAGECYGGLPGRLAGVPGFYTARGLDGSEYWTLAGSPGLLIPCLDPQGRIRAYRIRPDRNENQQNGADDPPKYIWFSSGKKPGGTGSGAHCHVARPLSAVRERAVWVTEGEIKADLASERLGAVVLSIPGVGLWARCLPDLAGLLSAGGQVVIAMDSDWRTKAAVHNAAWRLYLTCQALGYDVRVALWDTARKGLDDLLTAGGTPQVRPATALPAQEWTERVSSLLLAEIPGTMPTAGRTLADARAELPGMFAFLCQPCA
jgi:hypothetical protein